MIQKRRVIYLSDDQWATLGAESKARRQSISSLVRDWLRDLWTDPEPKRGSPGPVEAIMTSARPAAQIAQPQAPIGGMSQKARDVVLRKMAEKAPR